MADDEGGAADEGETESEYTTVSMSNTKQELIDAAIAAGLGTEDELNALTKAEILALFPEE